MYKHLGKSASMLSLAIILGGPISAVVPSLAPEVAYAYTDASDAQSKANSGQYTGIDSSKNKAFIDYSAVPSWVKPAVINLLKTQVINSGKPDGNGIYIAAKAGETISTKVIDPAYFKIRPETLFTQYGDTISSGKLFINGEDVTSTYIKSSENVNGYIESYLKLKVGDTIKVEGGDIGLGVSFVGNSLNYDIQNMPPFIRTLKATYKVNFVDTNDRVVGSYEVTGKPKDYVDVDDSKLPEGYTLADSGLSSFKLPDDNIDPINIRVVGEDKMYIVDIVDSTTGELLDETTITGKAGDPFNPNAIIDSVKYELADGNPEVLPDSNEDHIKVKVKAKDWKLIVHYVDESGKELGSFEPTKQQGEIVKLINIPKGYEVVDGSTTIYLYFSKNTDYYVKVKKTAPKPEEPEVKPETPEVKPETPSKPDDSVKEETETSKPAVNKPAKKVVKDEAKNTVKPAKSSTKPAKKEVKQAQPKVKDVIASKAKTGADLIAGTLTGLGITLSTIGLWFKKRF